MIQNYEVRFFEVNHHYENTPNGTNIKAIFWVTDITLGLNSDKSDHF